MYVARNNVPNFSIENKDFNFAIQPLVDEIFQQQSIGPEGYQESSSKNFQNDRHRNEQFFTENLIDPRSASIPKDSEDYIDITFLSRVEKIIAAHLTSVTYRLLFLTGALGSGKTATSRFVIDIIKKSIDHEKCGRNCILRTSKEIDSPVILSMNFAEGFIGKTYEQLMKNFNRKFINKITKLLRYLYRNTTIFSKFIERISNPALFDWEPSFDDFSVEHIEEQQNEWKTLPIRQKCSKLFKWISSKDNDEYKIELLGYISRFLKEISNSRIGCFIMFFDNIDRLPEEVQNDILSSIMAFSELSYVKTFVTARLTSFGWVVASATYAWGHIEYAGNLPIDIITKRINYYLKHHEYETYSRLRKINYNYLNLLDKRMKYILKLLNPENSERLIPIIDAFSGCSIRRGLYLMERLFLTNTIQYKNIHPYEDDFIRSLLISRNEEGTMISDDTIITNIFNSQLDQNNSMLKIRILQILLVYKRNKRVVTIQDLRNQLNHFKKWNNNEIISSINVLINVRKRLAYVDGVGEFRTLRELTISASNRINITDSGEKYMEILLCDLTYIQEAFVNINWDDSSMTLSINHHSMIERFRFIRYGLRVFLEDDVTQMRKYLNSVDKAKQTITNLITNETITKISDSILRIILSKKGEYGLEKEYIYYEELKNWMSFLKTSFNYEYKLCGVKNEETERLITMYEKIVK